MVNLVNVQIYEINNIDHILIINNSCKVIDTMLVLDKNRNVNDIFKTLIDDIIYEYTPCDLPKKFSMCIHLLDKQQGNYIPAKTYLYEVSSPNQIKEKYL